jgi:hypothetical protein
MFFSEPGAMGATAAARASAAGASAGVTSKSDPGAAAWGFGSLAYRRTAAKTIYDRASIAAATAAAAAAQAGGVLTPTGGSSSSAAADSAFLQSWEGQHTPTTASAPRLSCMAMSAEGLAGGRLSCSSSIRSSSSLCDSSTGGPRTPSSSSGSCKTPSKLGQVGPGGFWVWFVRACRIWMGLLARLHPGCSVCLKQSAQQRLACFVARGPLWRSAVTGLKKHERDCG